MMDIRLETDHFGKDVSVKSLSVSVEDDHPIRFSFLHNRMD